MNAGPEPQKVTIDPAKYAPEGWDGRLWIGLLLHNTGKSKSLYVRILNGGSASVSASPEPDRDAKIRLMRDHQKSFLEWRLDRLESRPKPKRAAVVEAMKPYAEAVLKTEPQVLGEAQIRQAVSEIKDAPLGAERFLKLVGEHYSPQDLSVSDTESRINDLCNSWKESGSFGREIGCIVRTASNMEKVALTDVETGEVVKADPDPIKISAAKHEYEGFQVVFSGLTGCAEKVKVAVTDLKNGKETIPAANIKVNPVGYIRIFENQPREMLSPDPLLIGDIPNLKQGENQPVWVTVYVPEDTLAGEYKGDVVISSGKSPDLKIPLVLKVYNFNIPKKISLRSSFWMFRDQINRFYHLEEVDFEDYMKWVDFALEHRLCPIDVYEGRCTQLLDVIKDGKPNPDPDFTLWDRYIDRMLAGGASTIHLGQSHHQGTFFNDKDNPISSPEQVERVVESLKILRDHYKKRGIFDLHYMQLRDETSAPDSLNVYKDVGKELPDLKLLLTAPSGEARPLLDIPCPLTPGFDAGWRDEVKANGGEYWWYVCCAPADPQWPNLFLHQTAVQHRALFWQTWKNDVDGLLYWGLNFWAWYDYEWPKNNTGPVVRVPAEGANNFCPLQDFPGDGFSMYPGPTPSQPMSSIRLEVMRDGEEDYEYLVLLDRLIGEAEKDGKDTPEVKMARAVRKEARELVPGLTDYARTGKSYQQVRGKVADAIESLYQKQERKQM